MKIVDPKDFKLNNTIVTIGKFDCVHLGHQMLLKQARLENDGTMDTIIFTFDINPMRLVSNADCKYLIDHAERIEICKGLGVDEYLEYPFTPDIMNMTPEIFARELLVEKLGVKKVVCGDDFCFGKNRSGNAQTLTELGEKLGFKVIVVQRISYKDEYISSTRIRDCLINGEMEDVNSMLGRVYSLSGTVSEGHHIGRKNAVPTVNFKVSEDRILPPNGVYATKTLVDGKEWISITNIGYRPTFYNDSEKYVETFLLDYSGNLYGKNIKVSFYQFVRPEKDFGTPERLYEQIEKDIIKTKELFK